MIASVKRAALGYARVRWISRSWQLFLRGLAMACAIGSISFAIQERFDNVVVMALVGLCAVLGADLI